MIYQTIIHSFDSARKTTLADIIYCCKMMSFMALDSVTSYLHLKDLTITCKRMPHSPTRKKLKTSNVFSSFNVC